MEEGVLFRRWIVKLFEADQLGRRDMRLKGVAGVKKRLIMSSAS